MVPTNNNSDDRTSGLQNEEFKSSLYKDWNSHCVWRSLCGISFYEQPDAEVAACRRDVRVTWILLHRNIYRTYTVSILAHVKILSLEKFEGFQYISAYVWGLTPYAHLIRRYGLHKLVSFSFKLLKMWNSKLKASARLRFLYFVRHICKQRA